MGALLMHCIIIILIIAACVGRLHKTNIQSVAEMTLPVTPCMTGDDRHGHIYSGWKELAAAAASLWIASADIVHV